MGILSWLGIGLIAGLVARLVLDRRGTSRSPGLIATLLLGMAGAILGGILATVLGYGGLAGFDARSLVTAILGAILLLQLMRWRWG